MIANPFQFNGSSLLRSWDKFVSINMLVILNFFFYYTKYIENGQPAQTLWGFGT